MLSKKSVDPPSISPQFLQSHKCNPQNIKQITQVIFQDFIFFRSLYLQDGWPNRNNWSYNNSTRNSFFCVFVTVCVFIQEQCQPTLQAPPSAGGSLNHFSKILFFIQFYLYFLFYDEEPHQGKALRTHPWIVNSGYTIPPARNVYRVIQGSF